MRVVVVVGAVGVALGGWHPPARRLGVGTGTRVTGGGRALGGIAEEARFALLALGTLRVVLAVLGGDTHGHTWHQGEGGGDTTPRPLVTPPTPYQAVPKNGVAGAGVAVAAAAGACPQVGSSRHPLKAGGTSLARQPRVAHRASGDTAALTVASQRRWYRARDLTTSGHLHSSTSPAGPRPVSPGLVTSMATSLSPTLAMRPS